MNKAVIIGRLTRDPDIRFTPNGVTVTNFTVAVDRPFKNKDGEREADFVRVTAWRKLAQICGDNLKKGRLVGVAGRIQTDSWKNEQGEWRNSTEIVADEIKFLDWPKEQKKTEQELSDYDDSVFNPEAFEQTDDLPF